MFETSFLYDCSQILWRSWGESLHNYLNISHSFKTVDSFIYYHTSAIVHYSLVTKSPTLISSQNPIHGSCLRLTRSELLFICEQGFQSYIYRDTHTLTGILVKKERSISEKPWTEKTSAKIFGCQMGHGSTFWTEILPPQKALSIHSFSEPFQF